MSLHPDPPIHRTGDPWSALQQESLNPNIAKRPRSDQGFDIQIQAAPITNSPLEWRQAGLPPLDSRVVGKPVFQEDVPPYWSEHPPDLADRSLCLPNAAQRPGAHHAIKAFIFKRQFFSSLHPKVQIDWALIDPTTGKA
jgi:hypothetical protein